MEAIKATTIVTSTPDDKTVNGKVVKKSGKRIGFNYIILKSLKESKKNDVVKCLYIKSLVNFGICVIKEGTKGDTKDREGRDIRDRLIWQKELHEQLQHIVRVPRYLGSFEENGNYYLVIERIKGKSLYKTCKELGSKVREGLITGNKLGLSFLGYFIKMVDLLQAMHDNQVVHRDVSANNFIIMPSGKMAVIDMELSYSLDRSFPDPPFQLGTYGYMSPQQESQQMPSVNDDIFSIGAIILQVWSGIWPSKLTNAPHHELVERTRFLIPDQDMALIVSQCLDPIAANRPSIEAIRLTMEKHKREMKRKRQRPLSTPLVFHDEQVIDTIHRSVGTLASPLLADPEKGWFSDNRAVEPNPDKRKINKTWYTSFSMGAAGVTYLLSQLKKIDIDVSPAAACVQQALRLIEEKYINRIDTVSPSLHVGASGIGVSLSVAIQQKLFDPQPHHFTWINQLMAIDNREIDFANGIAGQGIAHWACAPFLHKDEMDNRLKSYADTLLHQQEANGSWIINKGHKKKKTTRGFARGAAGIIYFLLEYAMQYQDRTVLNAAQRGLGWLMKTASANGKVINWPSSSGKKVEPWWNEGAIGIGLSFLKAYSMTGEERYKKYASGALLNHAPDALYNNFGQEAGLAGLGEIYLQAWQVTGDEEWRERAGRIVQLMMHLKRDHPIHGPYWLVGNEKQPVAEFMNGNSGVIHFLARYLYPRQLPFPLFDY